MKKCKSIILGLIVFFMVLSGAASANSITTIFDGGSSGGTAVADLTQYIAAEEFTLLNDYTVTDVHFWAFDSYNGAWDGTLKYWFFDDVSGAPGGSALTSGNLTGTTGLRTAVNSGTTYPKEYEYSFDLTTPYDLLAGTYWLALQLDADLTRTVGSPVGIRWSGRDFSAATSEGWYQTKNLVDWTAVIVGTNPKDVQLQFELTGSEVVVPEPSTFLLLGGGLAGLAFVFRRRKKE